MNYFVSKRHESIRKQLEGDSNGYVPFKAEIKVFPVRKILGFGVAFILLLLLVFVGWLWGVVAGFRGSVGWGVLNICFYPLTPMIYGFGVRKDLGRRSAWWALICTACFVTWVVVASVTFS